MFRDVPYPDRARLFTFPIEPYTPLKVGGNEKPDPVTLLYFSYHQSSISPINYAPFCGTNFDCFVTQDGFAGKHHWANYSAIMTFGGPAYSRAEKLVGGKTKRDPKQIWIARGMESSINGFDFTKNDAFQSWFNFTAALSPKATFRDSYFGVIEKKNPIEEMSQIEKKYDWFKKDKDFCWMVSACGNHNDRFGIGSQIINKLPVKTHMWGKSFRNCMPKVNKTQVIDHGFTTRKSVEYEIELSKCKFYFAFENSNCSDYITEKFGNALANYAIPIVNGWRESYEQILPGSFIHIADFENYSRVAEYLSDLLGNKEEFFAYHKWRLTHEVLKEERSEMYNLLHCRVCEKVYKTRETNKNTLTQVSTIPHIGKLFQTMQTCQKKPINY